MNTPIRTKRATVEKLRAILADIKGAKPISFVAMTEVDLLKTDNPFGKVFKVSRVSAFTGTNYENAVNRALVKAGEQPTFEAEKRRWGQRLSSALVEHKGSFYLPAQILKARSSMYLTRDRRGRLVPVDKKLIEPYMPAKKESPVPITYRDYALSSIVSFNGEGQRLSIRDMVAK